LQAGGAEGAEWEALLLHSFENRKIDLIQKEAIQTIIKAQTQLGVKVLSDQYAGALSGALKKGLEIVEGIGHSLNSKKTTNNAVRSPQEAGVGGTAPCSSLSTLANLIDELLETASLGLALTTPCVLAILGKPNAGKSTLINAILGEERMIVHHEPGTTRDYVSEMVSVKGVPFELIDTAGMRETEDAVESLGIEMTREQLQRSDGVLAVFDNSRPFDREDEEILGVLKSWLMQPEASGSQQKMRKRTIFPIINKCDLPEKLDRQRIESFTGQPACHISARNSEGLDDLYKKLLEGLDTEYKPGRPVLFTIRQYNLLASADVLLRQNENYLNTGSPQDTVLLAINALRNIFAECLHGA
jgi:tRNA modification GTPase